MADEDAGGSQGRHPDDALRPRGPPPEREKPLDPEDAYDREATRRQRASDGGLPALGFSLPPISLPDVRLPERIRLVFPVPDPPEKRSKPTRVGASWVLLGVALADVLDALAVVWVGPETLPWVRATVGLALSVVFVGGAGLVYAWELLAILGGLGWLSLAPTLTVLVLARLVLSR